MGSKKKISLEGLKEISNLFGLSEALFSAVELKLFDHLDTKGKTLEEILESFEANPKALERLLLLLAGAGIIKQKGRRYKLYTHTATYLQSNSENCIEDILLLRKAESEVWKKLPQVIKTGESSSLPLASTVEEQTLRFQQGMRAKNIALAEKVVKKMKIQAPKTEENAPPMLLELCLGPASFSAPLLKQNRGLNIIGYDLPETLKVTRKMFNKSIENEEVEVQNELSKRIRFVEGDLLNEEKMENFLKEHEGSFDAAFMADAAHIWDDETLRPIFSWVRKLLKKGGTFYIYDYILNENRKSPLAALQFNMTMQLLTEKGKVYTKSELRSLLHSAGFGALSSEPIAGAQHLLLHARKQG